MVYAWYSHVPHVTCITWLWHVCDMHVSKSPQSKGTIYITVYLYGFKTLYNRVTMSISNYNYMYIVLSLPVCCYIHAWQADSKYTHCEADICSCHGNLYASWIFLQDACYMHVNMTCEMHGISLKSIHVTWNMHVHYIETCM